MTPGRDARAVAARATDAQGSAAEWSKDPEARRVEEIPRKRWRSFFKAFSRSHEGWLATLEAFEPSAGTEVVVVNRPLEGISLDGSRICITVDGELDQHLTHVVEAPESVLLEIEGGYAEKAVKIRTASGSVEVRFRSALPPEMVDGIA
jgi:hypothetical protein